jgi:hypothetical protein
LRVELAREIENLVRHTRPSPLFEQKSRLEPLLSL